MARNMQLDFINRSPLGQQFSVVATHFDQAGVARVRALVVRGDVQALAKERGVYAARQSIVLDIIRRCAGEPGLDPAGVAKQLGMSVRYLHRLLEPTGRTFSQHLLGQRLERALAALHNPDSRLKIADIAFASGFSDISHFNRSFRRAFGDTPYGVRVRAARVQG